MLSHISTVWLPANPHSSPHSWIEPFGSIHASRFQPFISFTRPRVLPSVTSTLYLHHCHLCQVSLAADPRPAPHPAPRPRQLASFPYFDRIYHFRTIKPCSGNVHCCILNARLQSCGYEDTHLRTWSDVSVVAAERHLTSKTRNAASHRCQHWLPWGRLWCEPQAAGYVRDGRFSQPCVSALQ